MNAIAVEARQIARSAAAPVQPGETVKAQINRAVAALRLPYWRVREAWYGGAGCWSAAALEALRARHTARLHAIQSKQVHDAGITAARLEALPVRLAAVDAEFHAPDIAQARAQVERLRRLAGGGA